MVLGVSLDSVESHRAFAADNALPFPLVSDTGGVVAAKFGVPAADGSADRVTFLIGRDGVIGQVWPKVSVEGHAAAVLAAVRALPPAGG